MHLVSLVVGVPYPKNVKARRGLTLTDQAQSLWRRRRNGKNAGMDRIKYLMLLLYDPMDAGNFSLETLDG